MAVGASIATVTEHFVAVSINPQTSKHGGNDELKLFTVRVY
jgi:hypothetical protein